MSKKPTKEQVKAVMDEVDELDLPDGAHWAMIHERLGLEYGDVFDYFLADPEFFGVTADQIQANKETPAMFTDDPRWPHAPAPLGPAARETAVKIRVEEDGWVIIDLEGRELMSMTPKQALSLASGLQSAAAAAKRALLKAQRRKATRAT